jgi:hypothetical protein
MSINESRLNELEAQINSFGCILKDIRDELKSQNAGDKIQTVVRTKESELTFTERMKIQDILEDFNFQKVHDVMEQLDWKWAMTKYGVPTLDELKSEAKRLLIDACVEKTCVATGGFRAVYEAGETPDDPETYIALEFIIEECEGFVDDDSDDELDVKDDED